jgi:hypothetical protein
MQITNVSIQQQGITKQLAYVSIFVDYNHSRRNNRRPRVRKMKGIQDKVAERIGRRGVDGYGHTVSTADL